MASTAKPTSLGNRTLIRSLGLKVTRVVIDAGHGGQDTGSIGPTGYSEKDLVLDVAKRLKTLIETEIGAEVVMTRNDDTFVPLETRTAIANQQEADLFISIHANSSKTKTVRGVETFFLNFTTSKEALDTASRENAGSDKSVHELSDLVKKIVLTEKVTESRELAQARSNCNVASQGYRAGSRGQTGALCRTHRSEYAFDSCGNQFYQQPRRRKGSSNSSLPPASC